MTQQPNEQQDALMAKIAVAIDQLQGRSQLSEYDLEIIAQAALAAVREGHAVVPIRLYREMLYLVYHSLPPHESLLREKYNALADALNLKT
jgi:hypothetical protein